MNGGFRHRGGGWVVAQWLLMVASLAAGPLWPGAWGAGPGTVAGALALLAAGAVFGIAGAVALGRHRTTFPEPPADARLVTTGVYRVVRHPLYTSVILLSLAWAIGWRSVPALALALASCGFLDAKARNEESRLRLRFPDYDSYAARVRRLLPWIY